MSTLAVFALGLLAFSYFTSDDTINTGMAASQDRGTLNKHPLPHQNAGATHDLEDLLTYASEYERSVALRAALAEADEEQLLNLLEQTEVIADRNQSLSARREMLRRYAVVDPANAVMHALARPWNQRSPLIEAIFTEWAYSDVEAAVVYAKQLNEPSQQVALVTILRVRDDWSDERKLELAQDFGYPKVAEDLLEELHVLRAINNPEDAWYAILNDDQADGAQSASLTTILQYWVSREGIGVVSQIEHLLATVPNSFAIISPSLESAARTDPTAAFDIARGLTLHGKHDALLSVLRKWVENDPVAAIDAIYRLETPILRQELLFTAINAWGEGDPDALLQHLPNLSGEIQEYARRQATRGVASNSVEKAIAMISKLPNGVQVYGGGIVEKWAKTDVSAALDWILTQDEEVRPLLLNFIWLYLYDEDPKLALETALRQPIESGELGSEYELIRVVAQKDIDKAIAMLPHIRDDMNTRESVFQGVAEVLVRNDSPHRAIELGSQIPDSLREGFFFRLLDQWSIWDKFGLFEYLDHLPTAELRAQAAERLLVLGGGGGVRNKPYRFFSDRQVAQIETHL